MSAFVGEISSGVITVVFNMIILSLIGNIGVAAYGVVANTSLVAIALFNGIAQGSQPLISKSYGTGQKKEVHEILRMALMTSLFLSTILIAFIYLCAPQVTAVFNGEHNATLAVYAEKGLRLYFLGFFFAGINIVGTAALSAVESVKCAFAASIMRGFVAIIFFAFLLSSFFGMTGVWLAFPAAEFCNDASDSVWSASDQRLNTFIYSPAVSRFRNAGYKNPASGAPGSYSSSSGHKAQSK